MMSKLTFRARTLDGSKLMAIYRSDQLPELSELSLINRAVPALPSGMEKDEESEKHLQDILNTTVKTEQELIIPTPEVFQDNDVSDLYSSIYMDNFQAPRQCIRVQLFSTDEHIPEYNTDDDDLQFYNSVMKSNNKMKISLDDFEEIIDGLEKNSEHKVISAEDSQKHFQQFKEEILPIYDYWMDKRLRQKQPLNHKVLYYSVTGNNNNPYIAFRRRVEKMQTRKNRKNDEVSYEKMLKLRMIMQHTYKLVSMIKEREETKGLLIDIRRQIFDKRYNVGSQSNAMVLDDQRSVVGINQKPYHSSAKSVSKYHGRSHSSTSNRSSKRTSKIKSSICSSRLPLSQIEDPDPDDEIPEDMFEFRRKPNVKYLAPTDSTYGWPWEEDSQNPDPQYKYSISSTGEKHRAYRKRIGRGGRILFDRVDISSQDLSSENTMNNNNGEYQLCNMTDSSISGIIDNSFQFGVNLQDLYDCTGHGRHVIPSSFFHPLE